MKKKFILSMTLLSTISLAACTNSNTAKNEGKSSIKSEKVSKETEIKKSSLNSKNSSLSKSSIASSSSNSTKSSSVTSQLKDRHQITMEEAQNNNQPLSWEPIKNAQDAENLMKEKYGDQGWTTARGTVGSSSPIYFAEMNNNGDTYYVLATGQVTQNEADIKPVEDVPWTTSKAKTFYFNMLNANTNASLLPDRSWPSPVNGQEWTEVSNDGKTIKVTLDDDPNHEIFSFTNNGDGTSTFKDGQGHEMVVDNHNYLIKSKNY